MASYFHQAHARWRESFKELRAAERNLVESMRGSSAGTDVSALYEEVEQRRKRTSELFLRMERQRMTQAGALIALATVPNPGTTHRSRPEAAPGPQSAAPKLVGRLAPGAIGSSPRCPPDPS